MWPGEEFTHSMVGDQEPRMATDWGSMQLFSHFSLKVSRVPQPNLPFIFDDTILQTEVARGVL